MIRKLLVCLAFFISAPAYAEWREASSPNFIVYSEGSEQDARDFAERLEKFRFVLRTFHNVTAAPPPGKLRVFLFPSIEAVGRIAGSSGVAGFYVPTSRAMMMVGTRDRRTGRAIDTEAVLLHEYTHHFMYQHFPATYPTWYSEGFAEFWGATKFLPNDVVEIGLPAEHRFRSFVQNRWLPIQRLLTAQSYSDVGAQELDLLYAQGWLLVRRTFESPERKEQLQRYLTMINAGARYEDAMVQAFGPNGGSLNSELFNAAGQGRFDVVQLPFRTIQTGAILTRVLSPAEAAILMHELKLSRGVPQRELTQFQADVRATAARFPDDAHSLALLMEVERLAGDLQASNAAATRLLAREPRHARAMIIKALNEATALRQGGVVDPGRWQAVRQQISEAARLAPNDPLVLEAVYDSYALAGGLPPEDAQAALYTAHELAPSDPDLRYRVAKDFENRGMIAEAIAVIRPDAFRAPHRENETDRERARREQDEERHRIAGRERRETAREMLQRLQARVASNSAARPATPSPAPRP